jgi:predicted deacylase
MSEEFIIGGEVIPLRTRRLIELQLPPLYIHSPLTVPVHIVRGAKNGSRLFISAALHGDELNGTEIIRRLLKQPALKRLRGTLVAVPIVNVYGLIHHSRYLPDRRDLNRSFPGSEKGSLAARLAHQFMTEIVQKCTHGIDLHTGAIHRDNLPQIRANLDDSETAQLAESFGVPVLLNSNIRDGSLREAAAEQGIPMPKSRARRQKTHEPFVARSSIWVRASASGLFRKVCTLGARVKRGELLGLIDDPFGGEEFEVTASASGIVIGCSQIPLVHEGEALFHIARFEDVRGVAGQVESFQTEFTPEEIQGNARQEEPPIV